MRRKETRAAAVLPTRPNRPVRTSTVSPARPANAHVRSARQANRAVMPLQPRHRKEKAPDRAGALCLRILERDDFSSNRHPAPSRRRDRTHKIWTCPLDSEFVEPMPGSRFWQPRRARAIVGGHRRASLLGSVENETAICSENHHTKKPRPRPGLLIRRSLGEISTSQQPVHPN